MPKLRIKCLWLLLLICLWACEQRNVDELPLTELPQRTVGYVNPDDIPVIMRKVTESLHHRPGTVNSANVSVHSDLGTLDLEHILEVVDTLDNAHYTFLVQDENSSPFHFSNLVIKKRANGSIDPPYLLEYSLDSAAADDFVASGFAMDHFTGNVRKRFLTNFYFDTQSQANLEVRSNAANEPCDYDTRYQDGSSTSGGSPNTGTTGQTGGNPPAGGAMTMDCFEGYVLQEVKIRLKCYGFADNCWRTEKVWTKVMNCSLDEEAQSVYDGTNCPEPETGEVGVVQQKDWRILKILGKHTMTPAQLDSLGATYEEILDSNCAYKAMHQYFIDRNVSIPFVEDNSISAGAYSFITKRIHYFDANTLSSVGTIREEILHAFQDNYYPNGISEYANQGRSNIEFEAKFLADLTNSLDGYTCCVAFNDADLLVEFSFWIFDEVLTEDNQIKPFETYEADYYDWMEKFIDSWPVYNYPIDYNLKPEAILYLLSQSCN